MNIQESLDRIQRASVRSRLRPERFWAGLARLAENDAIIDAVLDRSTVAVGRPDATQSQQPIDIPQ